MPRIIVANCFQETNSFHPNPTTYENSSIHFGEELFRAHRQDIDGAINIYFQRSDVTLIPTYGAYMGAGGTVTRRMLENVNGVAIFGHRIVPRPIYPLDEDMSFTPHVEVFP